MIWYILHYFIMQNYSVFRYLLPISDWLYCAAALCWVLTLYQADTQYQIGTRVVTKQPTKIIKYEKLHQFIVFLSCYMLHSVY